MDTKKLKQAKKACGFTYKELSKRSGVPISTLYDVFRGVSAAPRIDTVQAIERALGLAPTAYEESAGWQKTKKSSLTTEEDEWLDLYYKLSSHGRTCVQTVTALIENYLNALSVK